MSSSSSPSRRASMIAPRSGWKSALRFSGRFIVTRFTWGSGKSTRTSSSATGSPSLVPPRHDHRGAVWTGASVRRTATPQGVPAQWRLREGVAYVPPVDSSLILVDDPAPMVRRITLNRPEKRNALNATMRREILDALHVSDLDPDVRVTVIRGAGKCFSAGYDLGGGSVGEIGRAHV